MPICARRSTVPPLGPIDGVVPTKVAFPHLVGRTRLLEQRLRAMPPGTYLLPADGEHLWLAVRRDVAGGGSARDDNGNDDDAVVVDIIEYRAFADASSLLNVGIGDEALRNLIASRLEQRSLGASCAALCLPTTVARWRIANMPREGVAVRVLRDRALFFSIASRHPNYFDLAATIGSTAAAAARMTTVRYNVRQAAQWGHSGDLNLQFDGAERGSGAGANFLVHSLWTASAGGHANQLQQQQQVTVWVSGYQQTPLARFADNRPTVFLLDADNDTLYYVPTRLDRATAGNHTACAVVTMRSTRTTTTTTATDGDGDGGHRWWQCVPVEGCYGDGDVNRLPEAMLAAAASIRF